MEAQGLKQVLYNALVSRFSLDELRQLCFTLGMDWDILAGGNKPAKARELVEYYDRRNALRALGDAVEQERPDVNLAALLDEYASGPHQVPQPPADFVGREAELDELSRAAESGGVDILGVQGLGGIGKTALAYKLIERLRPKYPNGDLLVELNGVDPEKALSPERALEKILHTYQPETKLPEALDDLKNLYRTWLHGKRVLILLDNAAGPEQVEPLLPPPPGCLAVITSRRHFVIDAMHSIDLSALPLKDAVGLILSIAPRAGQEGAEKLARACGRLPLALRLLSGLLRKRPGLTMEELLRRLRDEHNLFGVPELDKLETSLSLSYRMLSPVLQEKWRRLAVFAGDFDRQAAAWVWGLIHAGISEHQAQQARDKAQDTLDELCEYSLVDASAQSGRYTLHDLARAYAAHRMSVQEHAQARSIHAHYYVELLLTANRLYVAGDRSVMEGLALFDQERHQIEAGQAWAAGASAEEHDRLALCSNYAGYGVYVADIRLSPLARVAMLNTALRAARLLKDRRAEMAHLNNLGGAWALLGDNRQAISCYELQLMISNEIKDRVGEGNALGGLGYVYASLCQPRRAIEYYERWLATTRLTHDRIGEGSALGNLGDVYIDLGEPRRAILYYEQQLATCRAVGDRVGEGNALGSLGKAYADIDEPARGIDFCEQSLAIFREVGDRRGESNVLDNLGFACLKQGDARRAVEAHEQSITVVREIGGRRAEGIMLGNLANACAALGETARAADLFEQALRIDRDFGNRSAEAEASWNLGRLYEQQGDLPRAVALMQVRVDYEREVGHAEAARHAQKLEAIRMRIGA